VEISFIKLELFIVEIEVSENFVAFEEEIADHRSAVIRGLNLPETAMALVKKIHLGAKGSAALFIIEVSKEGIILAIENATRVKLLGEHFRQRGLPNSYRAFND